MVAVERFWQGDRNARMRLDRAPWGPAKLFRKAMTHLSWLAIGVVLYTELLTMPSLGVLIAIFFS